MVLLDLQAMELSAEAKSRGGNDCDDCCDGSFISLLIC